MAADLAIANITDACAEQLLLETKERKAKLRYYIEKLLREMFVGHEELLGITPD
jgi:hypothetical protein